MTPSPITKRQLHILLLLSKFRFLTRLQIQALLNHKNHTRISSWLRSLSNLDYVGTAFLTPELGQSQMPIYHLKLNGVQAVRQQGIYPKEHLRKFYKDSKLSSGFMSKCLFIADIAIGLERRKSHGHYDENLSYMAFSASELVLSPLKVLIPLQPDLVMLKQTKRKDTYFLLVLFDTNVTRAIMRRKLREFFQFYFSGDWEDSFEAPFPSLLLACPNVATLIAAKWLAKAVLEENQDPEDVDIRVGTMENLKQEGIAAEIWEPAGN